MAIYLQLYLRWDKCGLGVHRLCALETHPWGWSERCRIPGSGRRCWVYNTQTDPGPWPALWWCGAQLSHDSASPQRSLYYSPSGHTQRTHSLTERCSRCGSLGPVLTAGTWTTQSPALRPLCSPSRCTRWSHGSPPSLSAVHSAPLPLSEPQQHRLQIERERDGRKSGWGEVRERGKREHGLQNCSLNI